MEVVALLVGRAAVAEQVVGALAGDPVVEPPVHRPVAGRARRRLAVALHAAADRVAPRERAPQPSPAGC